MATNIKHSGDVTLGVLMRYFEKQSSVVFPNGCFVSFKVSEGLCGGDTPYGQETLFDLGDTEKGLHAILDWLEFWNDDRDEYGHLVSDIADTIKLESMDYCNRYYNVTLKDVVFTREHGHNSFSLNGVIVKGEKFSYWFSHTNRTEATPGNSVTACCLSIDKIRVAIETGKLVDNQVFL